MELEDGLAGATRAPQGACVTTNVRGGVAANVRGGYDGGDWGFYDDRVDNPNQQRGRIMKVVTVEQSRHVKS